MNQSIRKNFSSKRNREIAVIIGACAILLGIMTFVLSKLSVIPMKEAVYPSCFLLISLCYISFLSRYIHDRKEAGQLIDDLAWDAPPLDKPLKLSMLIMSLSGLFCIFIGLNAVTFSHIIWLGATQLIVPLFTLSTFRLKK